MSLSAIFNAIFSIFSLISSILIAIYHLVITHKSIPSLCDQTFLKDHPSITLSYLLLFVFFISGISLTLDSVVTAQLCSAAQYYGPALYSIFKTIVYVMLGCRIYISFKDSIYGYNTTKLLAWSILLTVWTLFNVIICNITVTSTIEDERGETKCIVTPAMIYIISQALLDLTAGIVNCILFVRPIFKLYHLKKIGSNAIKTVAYKQCILSATAIISSLVAMGGIGAFNNLTPVWVALDMFLSAISVILMYKWNSYITAKIFCCCMPSINNEDALAEHTEIDKTQTTANTNETNDSKTETQMQKC